MARPFFASGYTGAYEQEALGGEFRGAALRVGPERVATIDYQVAGIQKRHEVGYGLVDSRAGLDQEYYLARPLEQCHELGHVLGGYDAWLARCWHAIRCRTRHE